MVGRYGLYSRRSYKKTSEILNLYSFVRKKQISLVFEKKKNKKTYRQRMIEAFNKDPFKCSCCNKQMEVMRFGMQIMDNSTT
jgi:hypothetical protein